VGLCQKGYEEKFCLCCEDAQDRDQLRLRLEEKPANQLTWKMAGWACVRNIESIELKLKAVQDNVDKCIYMC